MSEISKPRSVCPKCGCPYKWAMTEEPIYQLVVFHFECSLCGTFDALSLPRDQFYEFLWCIEREKTERRCRMTDSQLQNQEVKNEKRNSQ